MHRFFASLRMTPSNSHRWLAAVICVLFTTPAFGLGRVECAAVESKLMRRPVRYCALLPDSYDQEKARRYPVLYFLHGIYENEQTLVDAGGWNLVEHLREQGKIGEFIILAPDGDASFFINSRDGRRPYEDFLVREFLPAVEKRYRVRAGRAARAITGISMGGYGALHLAFRYPRLFSAVSAHSAALIEERRGRPLAAAISVLPVFAEVFGKPFDAAYWRANNPLTLAQNTPGLRPLKIYFDCGREDDYGFEAGAAALDGILKRRAIAHEAHIYPGGHDWQYMAQHLPQSLEFHWKAFATDGRR